MFLALSLIYCVVLVSLLIPLCLSLATYKLHIITLTAWWVKINKLMLTSALKSLDEKCNTYMSVCVFVCMCVRERIHTLDISLLV